MLRTKLNDIYQSQRLNLIFDHVEYQINLWFQFKGLSQCFTLKKKRKKNKS